MFEDIDNQSSGFQASREGPDRALVYVIWTRNERGTFPVADAWSVLFSRYPNDARFLLFGVFEELAGPHASGAWSPSDFLAQVTRILDVAGGRLNPEVRDLLVVAEDDLHALSDEDAARLDRIRARVAVRTGDADAARKRLKRLEADVVRELHERTLGGRGIGEAAAAAGAQTATEWKSKVAEAQGPAKPYAPNAKVAIGDLLEHPKFGVGIVAAVEPGRAQILFESGARKLLSG